MDDYGWFSSLPFSWPRVMSAWLATFDANRSTLLPMHLRAVTSFSGNSIKTLRALTVVIVPSFEYAYFYDLLSLPRLPYVVWCVKPFRVEFPSGVSRLVRAQVGALFRPLGTH